LLGLSISAPSFRGHIPGQQEHLHDGSGRKRLDYGARRGFDLGRKLPDIHSGDPLDFSS
jgi:hypothetical protein